MVKFADIGTYTNGEQIELVFADVGVPPAEAAQAALRLWKGGGENDAKEPISKCQHCKSYKWRMVIFYNACLRLAKSPRKTCVKTGPGSFSCVWHDDCFLAGSSGNHQGP